jgi:hypothetical protein
MGLFDGLNQAVAPSFDQQQAIMTIVIAAILSVRDVGSIFSFVRSAHNSSSHKLADNVRRISCQLTSYWH